MYIQYMFIWDVNKAIINYSKHGISFEEAATIFIDDVALDWDDISHSKTEKRFKRLGRSIAGTILLVVYTLRRSQNDKETIRIISARQANRKERKAYFG